MHSPRALLARGKGRDVNGEIASAPPGGRPLVPNRIGPAEFGQLGGWITVRCPSGFDHLMRKAGGLWEPGSRRWLIERRRIGPVIRALRRETDPLFRHAGLSLDEP